MDSDPIGAHCCVPAEERLNIFALVIYIPDPLGRFLDDLRLEMVPRCRPHAHVSVLPPRPLAVSWNVAAERVRSLAEVWTPFDLEIADVRVFPVTNVVYLELGSGREELYRMHAAMNTDVLQAAEPFAYHPHITLAQEIPYDDVDSLSLLASRRWRDYRGKRVFRAERTSFVQNTLQNRWLDLAEYSLGPVTVP
ncbi:MAG TPA: 2'-5' RNA ligase family protein [Bryobacteraceae bacterium]|nr:2'-5' RNA ligase family protein [Bryobacteraceae bacterium]